MQLLAAIGREKGKKICVRTRSINLTGTNALLAFFCVKTCFHLNYRIFKRTECDLTAHLKLCHYIKKGEQKKGHRHYIICHTWRKLYRAGATLPQRQAERAGVIQSGEQKGTGRSNSSLPVVKGSLKESQRGIF